MKSGILVVLLAASAQASPYFRPIDLKHPVVSAQGFYDVVGAATPDYGTSLALITHSTRDGSLFKAIQADWTPLAVGGGYGNNAAFMALGPSANLAPAVKSLASYLLGKVTAEDKYLNLKGLLSQNPESSSDIKVSFGPAFLTKPIENGGFLPLPRWKGYFRIGAGASWQF